MVRIYGIMGGRYEVVTYQEEEPELNGRESHAAATLTAAYRQKEEILKAYRAMDCTYTSHQLDALQNLGLIDPLHRHDADNDPQDIEELVAAIVGPLSALELHARHTKH